MGLEVFDGGYRGTDTVVVGDRSVRVKGDVKVDAHEDALVVHINVPHGLFHERPSSRTDRAKRSSASVLWRGKPAALIPSIASRIDGGGVSVVVVAVGALVDRPRAQELRDARELSA